MNSTATFNPILSTVAKTFLRNTAGYAGPRIFPYFNTAENSAQYPVWNRANDLNLPNNLRRAPGAAFARSQMSISEDSYSVVNYGHETPVPDEIRRKYQNYFNADQSAVARNVDIIRVAHEKRVFAKVAGGGVPNATPAVKWSVPATATPRANVNVAKEAIRAATGLRPNIMVMAEPVRLALLETSEIKAAFQYTQNTGVTLAQLAAYFDVPEIVIAEQILATSQEGQTLTAADIWGDTVFLSHTNAAQDLMTPSFGRTFAWNATQGGGEIGIFSYRDEPVKSDIHRSENYTDEKIVYAAAGYRLDDVL